ncbi:MAG: hypothetical protein J5I94_27545 [Phaeodactylibacter sp.]|nr:hypothetical protein [Phaeodactylibacter sp.]
MGAQRLLLLRQSLRSCPTSDFRFPPSTPERPKSRNIRITSHNLRAGDTSSPPPEEKTIKNRAPSAGRHKIWESRFLLCCTANLFISGEIFFLENNNPYCSNRQLLLDLSRFLQYIHRAVTATFFVYPLFRTENRTAKLLFHSVLFRLPAWECGFSLDKKQWAEQRTTTA